MIKNTAGQNVGAQMVSASDGSAFTSTVTVYVTVDAGTQAIGTVGSGVCTHEGNGLHTYAPSQAETNGDLVEYTFIGTGAIPTSLHIYTRGGDAFTRLGAPAGASVSADVAAVKGDTAAILADTGTDGVVVATNNDKTGYAIGTGGIAAAAFAAGAITASAVAADAIGASELAADAASEVATAVLSAATSTPIAANMKQINSTTLTGDGSVTPWGPV